MAGQKHPLTWLRPLKTGSGTETVAVRIFASGNVVAMVGENYPSPGASPGGTQAGAAGERRLLPTSDADWAWLQRIAVRMAAHYTATAKHG